MLQKLKSVFTLNVLLIMLAAVVFNVIYYRFVYSNLVDLTTLYATNSLDVGTVAVNSNIEKKLNDGRLISKNTIFSDENVTLEDKLKILTEFKEKERRLRFYIAKPDGEAYSNYGEVTYFQEYSFFKKALMGVTSVSEPIYSYNDQCWIIAVASPIRYTNSEIESILISCFSVDEFMDIIKGINMGEGTINLISTEEHCIITTNSIEILNATNSLRVLDKSNTDIISLADFQIQAAKNKKGTGSFEYGGDTYFAVYETLDNSNWTLISAVPEQVLFYDVNRLSFGISCITVLVVLLSLGLTFYSKLLNRNLEKEKIKTNIVLNANNLFAIKIDNNGKIISANNNLLKATGYSSYELEKKKIYEIIPENYKNDFEVYLEKLYSGVSFFEVDIPILTKEKMLIYVVWNTNIESTNNIENIKTVEIIGTNITKIKDYEKKIQKLAYFDQLTGINNVAYLEEYFTGRISIDGKNEKHAFIFIDLDNFKYINDMFGHHAGDAFIVDICNRINGLEIKNAKLCRRSGDEFLVCLENFKDDDELKSCVEKIKETINEDYYINNLKYNITASIGVSIYPADGENYAELFKSADIAMNTAKDSGKGQVQYFNNEMKSAMYEIITIDNDLKSAIENNEFTLYYQPQYEIDTGKLYGFEALIRWISPTRGFVSPAKFIPQAEKNQMIIKIGDWALESACDFINEIKELGYDDICVSVNVSVVQMLSEDYVDKTLEILKRKNVQSKNIKLEITESVLMESIDDMLKKIDLLNKNGIYFSLDDFGTGYSSLTYLNKIPLKVLKIDKSFVDMIVEANGNPEIISSIIDLAHDIDLEVVAEGIEDNVQLQWLKNKGCNIAQGFFMGKPMPKDKAIEELGKNMYC